MNASHELGHLLPLLTSNVSRPSQKLPHAGVVALTLPRYRHSKVPRVAAHSASTLASEIPKVSWLGQNRPISFTWSNGETVSLSCFFLRDHCQCNQCRHKETQQRLVDTFELPPDIAARDVLGKQRGLSVTWDNDGHVSNYNWKWLRLRAASTTKPSSKSERVLWGAEISANPPTASYEEIMNSVEGLKGWLLLLEKYGFSYVDGCPIDPKATKSLLERIAFIRHTHYGGFWDFTSDLASKDTAYTNLALRAHTDNTYFTEPARLQMFHLLSHSKGDGGTSLLVDGFHAASLLKQQFPEAYNILASYLIPSHASGNHDISLRPARAMPVLCHTDSRRNSKLFQVRWNNDDRGTLFVKNASDSESKLTDLWYDAARKWVQILRGQQSEYWEQLRPGRPLSNL